MCDGDGCCRLVIFGPIFLVFALIGMLCLTAGYVNNTNFNNNLSKGTCVTKSTYVLADTCSYTCNCVTDSQGHSTCHTCYYTCYDGYVVAAIDGVTQGSAFEAVSSLQTTYDATNYLNANYPTGKLFTCYYTGANSTGQVQVYLNPKDANSSYIAGLVFCGLAAAVLLAYVIVELIVCGPALCDCFASCCYNCRRSRENRRLARETRHKTEKQERDQENERKELELELKKKELEIQKQQLDQSFAARPEDFTPPPPMYNPNAYPPTASSGEQLITPSAPPLSESMKYPL